jgi:hypothetical protein
MRNLSLPAHTPRPHMHALSGWGEAPLCILITGPGGWPPGGARGALTLKVADEVADRSAYDVEGYQLCVVRIKEDRYVLSPAGRGENGASGDEVVDAGACPAPQ